MSKSIIEEFRILADKPQLKQLIVVYNKMNDAALMKMNFVEWNNDKLNVNELKNNKRNYQNKLMIITVVYE